jgi:hypothetical protein
MVQLHIQLDYKNDKALIISRFEMMRESDDYHMTLEHTRPIKKSRWQK